MSLATSRAAKRCEATAPTTKGWRRRQRRDRGWLRAQDEPPLCFSPSAWPTDHVLSARELLPSPDVTTQGGRGGSVMRELKRLARPDVCEERSLMVTDAAETGFGSMVSSLVKPLLAALSRSQSLLTPYLILYADPARCADADFGCYFEPLSACDCGEIAARHGGITDRHTIAAPHPARLNHPRSFTINRAISHLRSGDRALPRAHRSAGWFRVVAQLYAYLMRPNAALAAAVTGAKHSLGWPQDGRVLSLHVRLGDACTRDEMARTARRCDRLEAYAPHVWRVARRYDLRHVFLATDDESVVGEARRTFGAGPNPLQLLSLPNVAVRQRNRPNADGSPAADGGLIDDLLRSRRVDGFSEGWAAALDLLLLAEGAALVGKFTSNMDRIAYALMGAARGRNCLRPFVSIDSAWCFDFGVHGSGIALNGTTFQC